MYERLDEFGIDFAVLYGSRTLTTTAIKDAEVRQVACRALNAFNAEVYAPYADRNGNVDIFDFLGIAANAGRTTGKAASTAKRCMGPSTASTPTA